jgi:hypothetical protein
LLETSQKGAPVKIGSEKTFHASSFKLNPVLNGYYYDYEYGYLSENVKEMRDT